MMFHFYNTYNLHTCTLATEIKESFQLSFISPAFLRQILAIAGPTSS